MCLNLQEWIYYCRTLFQFTSFLFTLHKVWTLNLINHLRWITFLMPLIFSSYLSSLKKCILGVFSSMVKVQKTKFKYSEKQSVCVEPCTKLQVILNKNDWAVAINSFPNVTVIVAILKNRFKSLEQLHMCSVVGTSKWSFSSIGSVVSEATMFLWRNAENL